MAGFGLYVDWEDAEFQRYLSSIIGRVDDMTPVMADFSEHILAETMERFDKEEAPDGTGWEPLSEVTEQMRAEEGKSGKILQVDGILRNSIQGDYDGSGAGLASTNVEYAAIHNFGGTIKPKKGKALKFGNNIVSQIEIPQRQFLGFSDDDFEYFDESVSGWVLTGKVG